MSNGVPEVKISGWNPAGSEWSNGVNDLRYGAGVQMLRVAEIDWTGVSEPGEPPVAYLLRKQVPVYIKVHRVHQAVYRRYRQPVGDGGVLIPFVGIEEDAVFLRLGDVGLAEIAATGAFLGCEFSHDGYLIPRPFDRKELAPGRYGGKEYRPIVHPRLVRFEFDHAVIIDKRHRNEFLATTLPVQWPPLERFALTIEFRDSDLYLTGTDLASISSRVGDAHEPAPYPFEHATRIPGLYATFQAAHALNKAKVWPEFNEGVVTDWIQQMAGLPRMTRKCARFAAKMARLSVARTQGGNSKPLRIEELPHLVDNPEQFTFEFVSDGLTLLLAVADWWETLLAVDHESSRIDLARKLSELNFSEAEVVEAVRLIAGTALTKSERDSFTHWQEKKVKSADIELAKQSNIGT